MSTSGRSCGSGSEIRAAIGKATRSSSTRRISQRKSTFQGSSRNLHLVERFKRVGQNTLNYEFTVSDPTVWTRPWTVMIPLKGTEDKIYEYACHEGNTGMEGILSGHRTEEDVHR